MQTGNHSTDSTPTATLAIRAAVGGVFFISGLLKFLFENQGVGRFTKIGLPFPSLLAPSIGALELLCGLLIAVGFLTRYAALLLIADMMVAIATTKLPLLSGPGPEPVAALPKTGLWAFAYQARLDVTMLLACGFLAVVGAGAWSLDAWLARRRKEPAAFSTRTEQPA
jgi:uncharacterized membrane protein YphA (DoxX/SURF4 family)